MRSNKTTRQTTKDADGGPRAMPLYRQVKSHLVSRVLEREWKPGESLPSEMRLAEEYGLSQGTVRKAIEEMAADGLVSRQAGRGTFVTSFTGPREPFRFHRLRAEDGRKIAGDNVQFIHCLDHVRDARASAGLGIGPDATLTEVLRLRHFDDRPALCERILLPTHALPGIRDRIDAERPASIYMLLERDYNHLVTRVEEKVRASFPDPDVARLLDLHGQVPVLEVERVAYSLGGLAVEWRTMTCSTHRIHYLGAMD